MKPETKSGKTFDPNYINPEIRKELGTEVRPESMQLEAPEMTVPNPGQGYETVAIDKSLPPIQPDKTPGSPKGGWAASRPQAAAEAKA